MSNPKTESLLSKLEKNLPVDIIQKQQQAMAVLTPAPTEEIMMSDAEQDYAFTRERIKKLLKLSDEAMETLMTVASEAEHPRAFEVLATMLKTSADVTEQLIRLQKQRRELARDNGQQQSNKPSSSPQTNVGVFIGTTADLQKQLLAKPIVTVVETQDNATNNQ